MRPGPVVGGSLFVLVAALVLSFITGKNPLQLMQQLNQGQQAAGPAEPGGRTGSNPATDALAEFSKVVFKDVEDVWKEQFPRMTNGRPYEPPVLVLYEGRVSTQGCGNATSAVGPFYCGADSKVYIDLSFFAEMESKLNARGEFARAYVIAHEVGHHIQNLLGILEKIQRAEDNEMLVRLELQADYLAGVWAHHAQRTKNILEPGDIQSGIGAALAVGDDAIMRNAGRRISPENFTHGSSAQRVRWFTRGLETGNAAAMMDLFELPFDQL
jgi:hypothetical protein